jgi:single-strand selective monofunctional uracil DNA glycosylase
MELRSASEKLIRQMRGLRFGAPVTHVYNPLDYAAASHREYLDRYGCGTREVVLLGMNPGPWGMAQTGVPFGEVNAVRDWLGIEAPVGKPKEEHPKRPIAGFACHRSEVSGKRIWGWARDSFGTPKRFFARFYVANYCPLCFLEESGRNRTPDKLSKDERNALYSACDEHLRRTVEYLKPRYVVGVGSFAESRAQAALSGLSVTIGRALHPSPANPNAHRNWAGKFSAALVEMGIRLPKKALASC